MVTDFVHLHVHTEYSLLDGMCRIAELPAQVKAQGMGAVAITDHGVLFGALPFYRACREHGVKPILGCEVYVAPGSRFDKVPNNRYYHLTLLAETTEGYHNLIKLVSKGFTEGFYYKPRVDKALLRQHRQGLIALSGCLAGELAQALLANDEAQARAVAREYVALFGEQNYFIELQDHGLPEQAQINPQLIALARELGLPLVATNDTHYPTRSDAEIHDLLLCIGTAKSVTDTDRLQFPNREFFLKSPREMAELFAEVPEALANTVRIAERCNVVLPENELHLPAFPLPPGHDEVSYLTALCEQNLPLRYPQITEEVRARLAHELTTIERMGFAGYFLIVADFVRFAKGQGIAVGPGRGSAAGSLVAYVLGITDVDPLRFGLLFERFLNPERVDMPDIDIDFCYERRDEVIQYVRDKYGHDKVAQVITFGTLAARAAVRDVGRALGYPYAEVDRIAKRVSHRSLARALQDDEELQRLYREEPRVRRLIDAAQRLEGLPRHASTHAAGVVITPEPLTEHLPVYVSGDDLLTQYDMEQLATVGLLKMDFLGLRTLTVIQQAAALAGVDPAEIPLDDPATYALLGSGHTLGLFQLEAEWVAQVLKEMQPTTIDEIVATISLCRPGPMEFISDYLKAKQQPESIRYPHPDLKPILAPTYGIIVYQEQIMQLAAQVAGFSLGEADLLRRAVGKKRQDELERYREQFIQGAQARGYSQALSEELYELIMRFANYGFNKSHAAAYAHVAVQTAYLKAHYPAAFMAALMSSVIGNEAKLAQYVAECRRLGLTVLPPDINRSGARFTVEHGAVRFALGAVKQVGWGAIEAVQKGRPYKDLADLCARVDLRQLPKKALEALIKAGACDAFGSRRQLLEQLESLYERAQARQRQVAQGQLSFFDLVPQGAEGAEAPSSPPESAPERLAMEQEALGFYLSGHPLDAFRASLQAQTSHALAALAEVRSGAAVTVGGLLVSLRQVTTRTGAPMAFAQLADLTGEVELVLFPKVYSQARPLLEAGEPLLVKGRLEATDGEVKILADQLAKLGKSEPKSRQVTSKVYLRVSAAHSQDPQLVQINNLLAKQPGPTPVFVKLGETGRWLQLHQRVTWGPELEAALCRMLGPEAVVAR